MTNKQQFDLDIKGEGFNLSRKINETQVARIVNILLDNIKDDGGLSENGQDEVQPTKTTPIEKISVREFMNEEAPSTNPEKILVFSKYLQKYLDYKFVDTDNIKSQFEASAEPIPKNFMRDLKIAVANAWIAESHSEPGRFFVTSSGDAILDKGFSQTTAKKSGPKRKRSKGGRFQEAKVSEQVEKLEVVMNEPAFIDYWSLTKGDRILWLLVFSRERGIESLNYKEIELLASRIADSIKTRDISSLVKANIKDGKIGQSVNTGGIKVLKSLKPGIDYIKAGVKRKKGKVSKRSKESV